MADISLHYSSKAPLAGTYTAFANVLQLWRRRAHDRKELAKLDKIAYIRFASVYRSFETPDDFREAVQEIKATRKKKR